MRAIIEAITERVNNNLPAQESDLVANFAQQFFQGSQPDDLHEHSIDNLYGSVLSLWGYIHNRQPNPPLIRVYNPDYDQYGWQSSHTIIEIVTEDKPFLLDSISMALSQSGITIHLIIHPVMCIQRDADGQIGHIFNQYEQRDNATNEAVMRFEISRCSSDEQLTQLHQQIEHILADVNTVVSDWQPMRQRLEEIMQSIETLAIPISEEERAESIAYLRWLNAKHFTFVGYRAYDLIHKQGDIHLKHIAESGLGILREQQLARISRSFAQVPQSLRRSAIQPTLLILTKSTAVSTVHRPVHLDYIGIKRYDDDGHVIGEWRFLGLYGSLAYNDRVTNIPILRQKVKHVIDESGYSPGSHNLKTLAHILNTFPRDEMFQFTEAELKETAHGILHVMERHRLGVFMRKDIYERFVTALIYIPREHYSSRLRQRLQIILLETLEGTGAEFNVQLSDSPLARVHFIIRTQPGSIPDYDISGLRDTMIDAMLSWQDKLAQALQEHFGESTGSQYFHRFSQSFSPAYQEDFNCHTAVADIERLVSINEQQVLAVHLYRPLEDKNDWLRFKVYGLGPIIALSDILPMLERMGLKVLEARPYEIDARDDQRYWIIDFDMKAVSDTEIDVLAVKAIFQDAFMCICNGDMESDGFNRLVLNAGLSKYQITLLRAMAKYLIQTRLPLSQGYMEDTLSRYPHLAQQLVSLFECRFDPDFNGDRDAEVERLKEVINTGIDQVTSLDCDRILRQYLYLIQAILRTNYYQRDSDGVALAYFSMKLDPVKLPALPLPLPIYEIFVYSARMEGVHLRGGSVARGGIRWSDRREDFRTEILGLMKAQMVKNTVIVPVGAKGGFVVKRLPVERDRQADEVLACYRIFIRALLELTDNLVDGVIVSPQNTLRYDKDDSYLVVAADKGTASFSDSANQISQARAFWLDDAFASGGSSGYDHKKMGITARGAWEAVKRHFHELGINTQQDPFTVVGIGSMTGDVFGNGMLLSSCIKLVAAFNHSRIFIDPTPDPVSSFQERKRMFDLPKSNWDDYSTELISAGGGVYSRSAKSIELSDQAREVLGIKVSRLTPNELIQAIVKAPVDLLWNGAIGTYVKASFETDGDVGDRSNDAVRVNGVELRCRVVGEGGNLGFTQLGRVEYAQSGGAINTDFIDNSGGVDCSDLEVNIKILLGQVIRNGDMTLKQRDRLLVDMTDNVARLVLRHSYQQTQAISIAASQSSVMLADHARFIRSLEKKGRLKRRLEFLPNDEELADRQKHNKGLTRPEIAIFFSYSKIELYRALHASDISEDPYLATELITYFPEQMQERYVDVMQQHPLRREIIATQITNSLVNRMGGTFVMRLEDLTGASVVDIARCYTAAREIYNVQDIWQSIESLDDQCISTVQINMLSEVRRLLDRSTVWLLRHLSQPIDIAVMINDYQTALDRLHESLPRMLIDTGRDSITEYCKALKEEGVPKDLAQKIVLLDAMYSGLDIIELAGSCERDLMLVATVFFELEDKLKLFWLRTKIQDLPRDDLWQRKARLGLLDELQSVTTDIAKQVILNITTAFSSDSDVDQWLIKQDNRVSHCLEMLDEIQGHPEADLAMYTVVVREIKVLTHDAI